ncbi:MAG: nicotinamide riboside transporter PnuC [Firmicutes bacterium]|nr:nicotinamide riboside transporter PnuC [Bacillota bacterium]
MATRRKSFLREYSRDWRWFEYVMLALGIVVPIGLGIVVGSSVLEILASVFFITGFLLVAKTKVEGFFLAIVGYVLYIIVSFQKGLFGEVIVVGLINIPFAVIAIVSWLSGDKKKSEELEIQNIRPRMTTFLILSQLVMGVGYFFMLRAFGTEFLIISVLAMAANVMGDFLVARKNILGPYAYVAYDILTMTLWILVVINGATSAAVIIVMHSLSLVNDSYGAINWTKKLRKQNKIRANLNQYSVVE